MAAGVSSSHPLDAAGLRERVQAIVDQVLEQESSVLARAGADLVPLAGALRALMSGGKRLRPAFCYWGWRGALAGTEVTSELDDAAMRAAASLEFLQACALIHDDVMDGSDTRRGLPAAHHHFATLHRGSAWLGSPENFGIGAAILLGDLCLSWADQVLMSSGMPVADLMRGKAVYDEMRTELMAGQYLDLLEQARGGGSVERALQVVRYKSAKYTIERPLHLGAALAGAPPQVMEAYTAYGLPLGEAFQLRDDVLGVFGDPSQTGKPAGDDLREGKRTVLIAMATDAASPSQAAVLRAHLGDPALDADGVAALRAIIEETGALAATERLIDERLSQALQAAASPVIAPEASQILLGLAYAATRRTV
ncbi:MAG: polyprenyl synthetase family protein [Actinomycetales bacterium]|nr:polyprenyl synthetase family protein [Actinomycetales bacterium]